MADWRYAYPAEIARELAREITRRRQALDDEAQARARARQRGSARPPGRGMQHILADRRCCDGMALALSWLIGRPDEPRAAEDFIKQVRDDDQEKT